MNKVRCGKCNSVIESKHTHNHVTCKCGHVSVDGGSDYRKRSWDASLQDWFEIAKDGSEIHITCLYKSTVR